MLQFYGYKACGTSRKAEKFLNDAGISYQFIDITQTPPSLDQIVQAVANAGVEWKKAFNVSGQSYKLGDFKSKVPNASVEELSAWLAADGRLIKRPLLIDASKATFGFNEDVFRDTWA